MRDVVSMQIDECLDDAHQNVPSPVAAQGGVSGRTHDEAAHKGFHRNVHTVCSMSEEAQGILVPAG